MPIPLSFLERAVRSQFVLLPGSFYCTERKRKGLAYTVFIGMADRYGYRHEDIRKHLKLDEQTFGRYIQIYEANMRRIKELEEMDKAINPDSIYGKIRNKISLVESFIRFNS